MYTLLNGSKKNAGDFLIFERAYDLIKTHRKTEDFLVLPRWLPVDEHLDAINRSDALFICGGPGYANNFHPHIYPLVENLERIKVPIIPLAVGWSGTPAHEPEKFEFTSKSRETIQEIHSRIPNSSVRDVITEQIVKSAGVENVLITGCAAWYYLPMVEQDFIVPDKLENVVITTPAKNEHFRGAFQLLDAAKKWFSGAKLHLVFHRGMFFDRYTRPIPSALNLALAAYGKMRGYNVINAAYSTDNLKFYKDCDLHIGYRVHAHINFLSYRKPSVLIQEDGRGIGQTRTLGTRDVFATDDNLIEIIGEIVQHYRDTNFSDFEQVTQTMQGKYQVMKGFLESF